MVALQTAPNPRQATRTPQQLNTAPYRAARPHYELTNRDSEATADWFEIIFENFKIDGGGHLSGDHLSKGASIQI